MKTLEHSLQVAVTQYLNLQYPHIAGFAIPNGGLRNKIVAAKLKAEGVKSGVPDLFIAKAIDRAYYGSSGTNGLFLELKSAKGHLSPSQKEWIEKLTAAGYRCEVCNSFDSAKQVIDDYLK